MGKKPDILRTAVVVYLFIFDTFKVIAIMNCFHCVCATHDRYIINAFTGNYKYSI